MNKTNKRLIILIQLIQKYLNVFFSGINIKIPIPASAMDHVTVLPAENGKFYSKL